MLQRPTDFLALSPVLGPFCSAVSFPSSVAEAAAPHRHQRGLLQCCVVKDFFHGVVNGLVGDARSARF